MKKLWSPKTGWAWGIFGLSVLLAAWVSFPWPAQGEEFRVESEVFAPPNRRLAESVTLFADGMVYDFPLIGPQEITIFDPQRKRMILLNADRQLQTVVGAEELLHFTASVRQQASQWKGVYGFAARPEFQQDYDQKSGWLTLSSQWMTYQVKGGSPKFPAAAAKYQHFADWYARLNSLRGGLPPFARIELNQAIGKQGMIPEEVRRTVVDGAGLQKRKVEVRSRHLVNWRLSGTDRKRIATAADYIGRFRKVSYEDYRNNKTASAAVPEKR